MDVQLNFGWTGLLDVLTEEVAGVHRKDDVRLGAVFGRSINEYGGKQGLLEVMVHLGWR